MAAAYVLINCEYGSEEEIMKELKELPELTEIYQAYGSYDLIAKISADTIDKLKEAITWHIRRTDKIKSTLTLILLPLHLGTVFSSFLLFYAVHKLVRHMLKEILYYLQMRLCCS